MHLRTRSILMWLSLLLALAAPAGAELAFLAALPYPADGRDRSGLHDTLEDGTPHDLLGGIGSAIAYTGAADRYLLLPDRGPNAGKWNKAVDHTTRYQVRFHTFEIKLVPPPDPQAPEAPESPATVSPTTQVAADWRLDVALIGTTLLEDEQGRPYVGLSSAYVAGDPSGSARRDPEGMALGPDGTIYIADEYGPNLDAFSPQGRRVQSIPVPQRYLCLHPAPTRDAERPPANLSGRLPNKGFESLTISGDGQRLYTMTQAPLIQDNAGQARPVARGLRLLEIHLRGFSTREFLYELDAPGLDVCDLLWIEDFRFLVLERDGKGGVQAKVKRIYEIDLSDASEISSIPSLSAPGIPGIPESTQDSDRLPGVIPVRKTLLADLVTGQDSKGQPMAGFERLRQVLTHEKPLDRMPEKLEGMTLGPRLPDGRRLLLLVSDNDFLPHQPNWFFAFAYGSPNLKTKE